MTHPSATLANSVSTTIAVTCLVIAALMWTVGNKHFSRAIPVLVLTGAAGITSTLIGSKINQALNWLYQWTGQTVGPWLSITTVAIMSLSAFAIIYVLVMDIKKPSVDRNTLGCAAAVPFTVAAIPGPLGAAALTLVTGLASLVASGIGAAFGWN